jgi:hypothetical protein
MSLHAESNSHERVPPLGGNSGNPEFGGVSPSEESQELSDDLIFSSLPSKEWFECKVCARQCLWYTKARRKHLFDYGHTPYKGSTK